MHSKGKGKLFPRENYPSEGKIFPLRENPPNFPLGGKFRPKRSLGHFAWGRESHFGVTFFCHFNDLVALGSVWGFSRSQVYKYLQSPLFGVV